MSTPVLDSQQLL